MSGLSSSFIEEEIKDAAQAKLVAIFENAGYNADYTQANCICVARANGWGDLAEEFEEELRNQREVAA